MPSIEQMTASVHQYVAAFGAGDASAVLALYADDATVEDPVGSFVLSGHAAIGAFYEKAMAMGAVLHLDGPVRTPANYAAFAFHVDVDAQGTRMRIDVIDIFEFNGDGKIKSMRAFWCPQNMSIVA